MIEISPSYLMKLIDELETKIWANYSSYNKVKYYIKKWHISEIDYENFRIVDKSPDNIDLLATLNNIDAETLLKMAADLGVPTPGYIPSIPTFKNYLKDNYENAYTSFENALKQVDVDAGLAIGLANSTLESILKKIVSDDRILIKTKKSDTLYQLTVQVLKGFRLLHNDNFPEEIKSISNSLTSIAQNIENLRSGKTHFHGKLDEDYLVKDSIYAVFIINCIATVGLFLNDYYDMMFPKNKETIDNSEDDDLPF